MPPSVRDRSEVSTRRATMNSLLPFLAEQPWIITVIGTLVSCLAFLMGWRWLIGTPAPVTEEPVEEETESPFLSMNAAKLKLPRPDRRAAPRRKGGNRVEVYLTHDEQKEPLLGWVVDRSMGGLCLNVEEPLDTGTILNVRPRRAPQTAPWLAIEVRSCRPEGTNWEVGCRFLKPPQWNDLLLFG